MVTNTRPSTSLPAVDVVIPMFQAERYIRRTLGSVLAQTHAPARIIVVDDGSTDGSREMVKAVMQEQPHLPIQLLEQPNSGPNAARNRGVQHGQAPYVALLDADDLWGPTKLEEQLTVFVQDGQDDLLLVYCGAHWIDADDHPHARGTLREKEPLRGHVFEQLLPRNTITGGSSAVMIRRDALVRSGGFDETLRAAEDFDMWLRLARAGRVDLAPNDLAGIRLHDSNTTKDTLYMLSGLLDFYVKWFPEARDRPEVCHEWGHLIALFTARAKDCSKAQALVHQKLTPEMRKAFFRRTGGSLRWYVWLKRLRAWADGSRSEP